MNDLSYALEIASFDEKCALAALETAKATEREREIFYEKCRFQVQWLMAAAKSQQEAQAKQ